MPSWPSWGCPQKCQLGSGLPDLPSEDRSLHHLKSPFQGSQSFMILTGVVSCVVMPLLHAHSPVPLYILVWMTDAEFPKISLFF